MARAAARLLEGETGLSPGPLSFLGAGDLGFPDDPFGHDMGTHAVTLVLSCRPEGGAVSLDGNHSGHVWAAPGRRGLHPYVRHFLRLAGGHARGPSLWGTRGPYSGIRGIPQAPPVSYTMRGGGAR